MSKSKESSFVEKFSIENGLEIWYIVGEVYVEVCICELIETSERRSYLLCLYNSPPCMAVPHGCGT